VRILQLQNKRKRLTVSASLAINSHDLPLEGLGKGLGPGGEAGLKGVRVDQPEDAPEGVIASVKMV
jgi:hypothetical protein